MSTNIKIIHLEHPEDEKILEKLEQFETHSKEGFLKIEGTDRVFVISGSASHDKIKEALSQSKAYPLGDVEVNGVSFAEYSVNESFFKS